MVKTHNKKGYQHICGRFNDAPYIVIGQNKNHTEHLASHCTLKNIPA